MDKILRIDCLLRGMGNNDIHGLKSIFSQFFSNFIKISSSKIVS